MSYYKFSKAIVFKEKTISNNWREEEKEIKIKLLKLLYEFLPKVAFQQDSYYFKMILVKENNKLDIYWNFSIPQDIKNNIKNIFPWFLDYEELNSGNINTNRPSKLIVRDKFITSNGQSYYYRELIPSPNTCFLHDFSLFITTGILEIAISPLSNNDLTNQWINGFTEDISEYDKEYINKLCSEKYKFKVKINFYGDDTEATTCLAILNASFGSNSLDATKLGGGFSFSDNNQQIGGIGQIFLSTEIEPLLAIPISINREIPYMENKFISTSLFPPVFIPSTNEQILLGETQYYKERKKISIPYCDLTRHVFIAGTTGSGKTRTVLNILRQLNTPFLVLEPILKNEYRSLCRLVEGVSVYTPGKQELSPLRINIFQVPQNVCIERHLQFLLFSFISTLPDPGELLPLILENAMRKAYQQRGWDVSKTPANHTQGNRNWPTFQDLQRAIDETINEQGYHQRNEFIVNAKAALRLRFTRLTEGEGKDIFLNNNHPCSIEELLAQKAVIELGHLSSEEIRNFLLAWLFTCAIEYREAKGLRNDLQHVTVIEEAHRFLTPSGFITTPSGTKNSGTAELVIRIFSNALAEMRGFGEGIIIVEQSPSKIVSDVIKNTGLKIMHRIFDHQDRIILGCAMGMNEDQTELAMFLKNREVFLFSDRFFLPIKMEVSICDINNISDNELRVGREDVPES